MALRERMTRGLDPGVYERPAWPASGPVDGVAVLLRVVGKPGSLIPVARRLGQSGVTLKDAHTAITALATLCGVVCCIERGGDFSALAADLLALGVDCTLDLGC